MLSHETLKMGDVLPKSVGRDVIIFHIDVVQPTKLKPIAPNSSLYHNIFH